MHLNEFDELFDKVYPNQINLKSFEVKDQLCPKIWNNGKLIDKVRKKLLDIAKEFVEFLDIDKVKPVDIVFVGSLASYNWSKYSDIDCHIIIDFAEVNEDTKLIDNYMYMKKCEWNETHKNLKIYGYEVELFVEDKKPNAESNGIFSIKNNYWIKFPSSKKGTLEKDFIKDESAKIINKIEVFEKIEKELLYKESFNTLYNRVTYLYDNIIQNRRDSIAQRGEFGSNNIVFKVLRRSGHLERLHKLKDRLYDKVNSLSD